MNKAELTAKEYDAYYETYLKLVNPSTHLLNGLKESLSTIVEFFKNIPEEKLYYQYSEGKWTPKEILQHLIDTERIFTCRSLRIARNDFTELPGFNENAYVPAAHANQKTLEQLIYEYESLRNATLALYNGYTDIVLQNKAIASESPISVRAIPFILIGHELHHIQVIKERYLL